MHVMNDPCHSNIKHKLTNSQTTAVTNSLEKWLKTFTRGFFNPVSIVSVYQKREIIILKNTESYIKSIKNIKRPLLCKQTDRLK